MYLITVARAVEAGAEGPVAISRIAETLGVSVPSANEMVRKLDNRGLLVYEPYRGARLSDTGRYLANQVLRTRRLWATFLAEHLGFSPTEADDQACHLEHATTAEAANRLATYLGNPAAGPLGRPIPGDTRSPEPRAAVSLADVAVGMTAEIDSITAEGRKLEFLKSEGMYPGTRIEVVAAGNTGLLIDVDGIEIHLSDPLVRAVLVRPVEVHNASA